MRSPRPHSADPGGPGGRDGPGGGSDEPPLTASPQEAGGPRWLGRVVGLAVGTDHTTVWVRLPDGDEWGLPLPDRPDSEQALSCTAGTRRVQGVLLQVSEPGPGQRWTASLVGVVGRYRQLHRPVPLPAALALTERGIPTYVTIIADAA